MSARKQRSGNRGQTRLATRRRQADPMDTFDQLPAELRAWVREASLPWSPHSCLKIWKQAKREGLELETIFERLDRAEAGTLAKV